MKTTNLNGKQYRVYNPDEFFNSQQDEQQKLFDLNEAKVRYGDHSKQKKKTSSENANKN